MYSLRKRLISAAIAVALLPTALSACRSVRPAVTSDDTGATTTVKTTTAASTTVRWEPAIPPESDDIIVCVSDYTEDIMIDMRYGGTNNSTATRIYKFDKAYLRYGTVKKLIEAQKKLSESGLRLVIWDAFRPLEAQISLYYTQPECMISPAAGRYVRYNNADAVSVAAVKADGTPIELPSDFFGENRSRSYTGASAEAKSNAALIDRAMTDAGMVAYLDDEWYSYADSNEYPLASTVTADQNGLHECESWIVDCNEAISLRAQPNTASEQTARVGKGEKVKVIFFSEKFAYCEYNGQFGYALAAYLVQSEENGYSHDLTVVKPSYDYDYDRMQSELTELVRLYPEKIRLKSIGKSEEGRDLTVAVVGNPDAENRIFISAAIHAREYMTAAIAMGQIEYLLSNPSLSCGIGEITVGEMLENTAICVLPFTNPDGAMIVTSGVIPEQFRGRYNSSYTEKWKANARGVDLNANFDADWERYGGALGSTGRPSYMSYKGTSPECAAESKAVADYIRSERFDLVLCYHTTGSYIYASYKNYDETNAKCNKVARCIAGRSGYIIAPQSGTSTAGLKDWCIKIGIPALTIEFGTASNPLMLREFDNIWARTKEIPILSYLWVSKNC